MKLTDQIIEQLKRQAEDINRLQHGEVNLKVQDGRLVKGDIKKSFKPTDSKNERLGRN